MYMPSYVHTCVHIYVHIYDGLISTSFVRAGELVFSRIQSKRFPSAVDITEFMSSLGASKLQ
jgi:hypothetical protein